MKQLLFLLLFPCLAMAQYQGNGNQKITLGEQTSADGLVYRGLANLDTVAATSKITRANKLDTSAYLLLDTVTNLLWHYKIGSNAWTQAGGGGGVTSFSAGTTGLTPSSATTGAVTLGGTLAVANGGTGTGTAFTQGSVLFAGASGTYAQDNSGLFFDATNNRLGIGVANPSAFALEINGGIKFEGGSATRGLFMQSGTHPVKTRLIRGTSGTTLTENWDSVDLIKDDTLRPSYIFNLLSNNTPLGCSICDAFEIRRSEPTNNKLVTPIFKLNGTGVLIKGSTGNPSESLHVVGNARITGNIAAGVTSATARLHLAAGTATAGTAPLKFTSGTNLTAAEAGVMEFNGTNLFFSPSTTRHTVNHGLTGSASLDFPSTSANTYADLTISITGAALSDVVSLGIPNASMSANNITYTAWVSAANTVTVRFANHTTGSIDPASGTFKVFVTK